MSFNTYKIKNEDFCKIISREISLYKNQFVETSFSVFFLW